MLRVVSVKEDKRREIPAVTHVDGSARVQTVSKKSQPLFWKLLMRFGQKTGTHVLLNTSFNENEPVVCTSQEAIECFLRTQMDALVIHSFFVPKRKQE